MGRKSISKLSRAIELIGWGSSTQTDSRKREKEKKKKTSCLSPYLSLSFTRAATMYVQGKKREPRQTSLVDFFARFLFSGVSRINSRAWRTHRGLVDKCHPRRAVYASKANTDGKKVIPLVKGDARFYRLPCMCFIAHRKRRRERVAAATLTVLHLRKPRVWNVYFGDRSEMLACNYFFNYLTRYTVIIPYAYT